MSLFYLDDLFKDMVQFLPCLQITDDSEERDDDDESEGKVSQPTSQH
jgi:hypothetical protein